MNRDSDLTCCLAAWIGADIHILLKPGLARRRMIGGSVWTALETLAVSFPNLCQRAPFLGEHLALTWKYVCIPSGAKTGAEKTKRGRGSRCRALSVRSRAAVKRACNSNRNKLGLSLSGDCLEESSISFGDRGSCVQGGREPSELVLNKQ